MGFWSFVLLSFQIQQETDTVVDNHPHHSEALYGSGKSKFYVNADDSAYETVRQLPVCKHPTMRNNDRSLYLANSTFYRDTVPLVVPVSVNDPDPPPIVAVEPGKQPAMGRKKWLHAGKCPVNGDHGADMVTNGVGEEDTDSSCGMKVNLPKMIDGRPCQTSGCSFFGTSETNFYCSKCFKESQRWLLCNQASQI